MSLDTMTTEELRRYVTEHFEESNRNYWTIEAMVKFGGSFVKALAECARLADRQNLAKIKMAWGDYWAEYETKGRKLEKEYGTKT